MKKKSIILLLFMCLFITACGKEKEEIKDNPIVTMTIKDYGDVTIELYPNIAPNTVANFVNLIEDGFYDNNTIHRIVKEFVIQGGDPTASGTGGPGYTINGEFTKNGFENDLSHTEGILSMARSTSYDSAGSQFFIMLSDKYPTALDGIYAAFGKVTEGMDIVHEIENQDYEYKDPEMGTLKEPLTIEKVTVDTKGYTYKVEKIN